MADKIREGEVKGGKGSVGMRQERKGKHYEGMRNERQEWKEKEQEA